MIGWCSRWRLSTESTTSAPLQTHCYSEPSEPVCHACQQYNSTPPLPEVTTARRCRVMQVLLAYYFQYNSHIQARFRAHVSVCYDRTPLRVWEGGMGFNSQSELKVSNSLQLHGQARRSLYWNLNSISILVCACTELARRCCYCLINNRFKIQFTRGCTERHVSCHALAVSFAYVK